MSQANRNDRRKSFLTTLKELLIGSPERNAKPQQGRNMTFERLDDRNLMAADFGAVIGKVYNDPTNGGYDPSKVVANAAVQLYRDTGNLAFDNSDTLVATVNTNSSGQYRFDGLGAGSYFARVGAQTIGSVSLRQQVSSIATITNEMAAGSARTMIDDFNTVSTQIVDGDPGNGGVSGATNGINASATIGTARKLIADMITADTDYDTATLQVRSGRLDQTLSSEASGKFTVAWDGGSGTATSVNATGLGGVNLKANGASAIQLRLVSLDHNATATVRVYTNAGKWSEFNINLDAFQATGGAFRSHYVRFTDTASNSAGGGVDWTSVGAITLTINGDVLGTDSRLDFVNTVGSAELARDFSNLNRVDLKVDKTVNVARPNEGDTIQYTITVTNLATLPDNTSGGAVANVKVTDILPASFQYVSQGPSGNAYDATSGIWNVGTLAAGGTATLTISGKVMECDPFTNTATVSTTDGQDVNAANNSSSVTVTPKMVDLGITKTASKTKLNAGENVTFTIKVSNASGMDNATGVSVLDQLPTGMTLVGAAQASQGSYDATTGIWTVGSIASGSNATLTMVAKIIDGTTKINTAEIVSVDQCDDNAANDTASASVGVAKVDLALTKTVDTAKISKNENFTYTIRVTNESMDTAATGVKVTDLLPAGLTFVSASAPPFRVDPAGMSYDSTTGVWTIGMINANSVAELRITAKTTECDTFTNTATISAVDQVEDNTANNSASATVAMRETDLQISKTVDNASPNIGQVVTFTVNVKNNGPDSASGVKVLDTLPAGLQFDSATAPAGTTFNSATGVWDVGNIANGATITLVLKAKVIATGTQTNTAAITGSNECDDNTANDAATASVTNSSLNLKVLKSVSASSIQVDQTAIFTITVTNESALTATNVRILDNLPTGIVTTTGSNASQGSYANNIWNIGTLTAGQTVTLQLTVKGVSVGQYTNTASLNGLDQTDSNSADNQATAGLIVTPKPIPRGGLTSRSKRALLAAG